MKSYNYTTKCDQQQFRDGVGGSGDGGVKQGMERRM